MNGRTCASMVLCSLALVVCGSVRAQFRFTDGVLAVTTSRYEVTWQNGSMARLVTRLPSRQDLSVAPGPMAVTMLANGPGSFGGNEKAGLAQHRVVWGHDLKNGPPSFPAQHPPNAASRVECVEIRGGVRLTYTGLTNDPTGVLVQELTVEKKTGDLVIRQNARSGNPGLFGIGFSLLNLRPDIEFAVPYFGGQRFGGTRDRGRAFGYGWPQFWSAGLVVGEVPGGGSFIVFADDPGLGPKYLRIYDSEAAQALGFEACAQWPYAERKDVTVCTWRFNTFGGSWVEPAKRYRDWLAATFQLQPWEKRPAAWINDIAMVWMADLSPDAMREFAKKLAPKHVLILNLGWAKGFNRNAPYYQPGATKLPEAVQTAHAMGYHYGVYVAHKLLDRHAYPELFEKYDLKLAFDGLSQEPAALDTIRDEERNARQIAKDTKGSYLAEIHPGRRAWIEFYAEVMRGFHQQYGLDVFYQDVTGANCGSSGVLDGLSLHEGTMACERRIHELLPGVAATGEFWNEVNVASGQEFGLQNFASWFNREHLKRLAANPHPLMGAIFNDFCRYISFRTPIREVETFHLDQNYLEVMGALPVWTAQVDAGTAEARVMIERARLLAAGFKPYYPEKSKKGVVAWLRDGKGQLVKYVRDGESTYCWREVGKGRRLVYGRVKGVGSVSLPEPVNIDGWMAYGKTGPIGLCPDKWYCVFPAPPAVLPVTITDLPDAVHVGGVRTTADYCLVELTGTGAGTVRWTPAVALAGQAGGPVNSADVKAPTALVFGFREPQPAKAGEPLPLAKWDLVKVTNGLVTGPAEWQLPPPRVWNLGDKALPGYMVAPETGGEGTEVSIDGYLRLPDDKSLALAFSMGRLGGAGDGVDFVVRVNGRRLWKQFSEPDKRGWTPVTVPLGEYAGQTVVLSLAVDCGAGGFNTSNDQALWGEPRLVTAR